MFTVAHLDAMNTTPELSAIATSPGQAGAEPRHHQRSKSSVLRSLMGGGHKRNNSDGSGLPPAPLSSTATIATTPAFHMSQRDLGGVINSNGVFHVGFDEAAAAAMEPERYAYALGDLQQSRRERSPERSPERPRGRDGADYADQAPPSPSKTGFSTMSLMGLGAKDRDSSKPPKTKEGRSRSPSKPKKAKSATNLAVLLSRPKSIKSLKQLLMDEDDGDAAAAARASSKEKDKENRTPPDSLGSDHNVAPGLLRPPYPQFTRQSFGPSSSSSHAESSIELPIRGGNPAERAGAAPSWKKPRPKSFQAYGSHPDDDTARSAESHSSSDVGAKRMTWGKAGPPTPSRPAAGSRAKLASAGAGGAAEAPFIDPKDIDKHLEAMLDRRNIPENQRYKMRNLSDTIKMEFIRQDWAEMQAKLDGLGAGAGASDAAVPPQNGAGRSGEPDDGGASPAKKDKKKHGRGLSLTLVRAANKTAGPASPLKRQKGDSSLGRHLRTKSSESLVSDSPLSAGPFSGYGSGFLAKVKGQQLPGDFVAYLQRVRQPELVEVGKLHKLRLLLRNETVAWTDEFVRLGGMCEIVDLLHRIMAVEWRYVCFRCFSQHHPFSWERWGRSVGREKGGEVGWQ